MKSEETTTETMAEVDPTKESEVTIEETVVPEGATVEEGASPEPTEVVTVEPTQIPVSQKVDFNITVAGKIKYISNAKKVDKNTVVVKNMDKPVVIVYK